MRARARALGCECSLRQATAVAWAFVFRMDYINVGVHLIRDKILVNLGISTLYSALIRESHSSPPLSAAGLKQPCNDSTTQVEESRLRFPRYEVFRSCWGRVQQESSYLL